MDGGWGDATGARPARDAASKRAESTQFQSSDTTTSAQRMKIRCDPRSPPRLGSAENARSGPLAPALTGAVGAGGHVGGIGRWRGRPVKLRDRLAELPGDVPREPFDSGPIPGEPVAMILQAVEAVRFEDVAALGRGQVQVVVQRVRDVGEAERPDVQRDRADLGRDARVGCEQRAEVRFERAVQGAQRIREDGGVVSGPRKLRKPPVQPIARPLRGQRDSHTDGTSARRVPSAMPNRVLVGVSGRASRAAPPVRWRAGSRPHQDRPRRAPAPATRRRRPAWAGS